VRRAKASQTKTQATLALLRAYESRNVTYVAADGSWPIVWERARGVNVWDAEGRRYLDLTAAFGVAAAGHANPHVVRAGQQQMGRLLHAMGDVHPHALKGELARRLSELTFGRWSPGTGGKSIFCNSGFEAVEAALKTAVLATGKPGIIAFEGAYHGLGYGALNATHRAHFHSPFHQQLAKFGRFVPFPTESAELESIEKALRGVLRRGRTGAVLVEPIQARGGINVPTAEFLPMLRRLCDEYGTLLILDEIYTGFGRTGRWFACEHPELATPTPPGKMPGSITTVPDLICLGKALTGGFPLAACVGRAEVMDAAWPLSEGEAIHTSTFLGHPVGCAMALAQIQEIQRRMLVEKSCESGKFLLGLLHDRAGELNAAANLKFRLRVRGLGLLCGLEVQQDNGQPGTRIVLETINRMLHSGYILLPEGEYSQVISFSPPLIISRARLSETVEVLSKTLREMARLAL
jgi:4-aminobutyrate aminotransferase-like enzyme